MKRKIIIHKNKDGTLVYRIDPNTKIGEYHLVQDSNNSQKVRTPIKLVGFERMPSGFYKEGYGLTAGGKSIIDEIYRRYEKSIDLTVTASRDSKLDARGKSVKLSLSQLVLSKAGEAARTIRKARNEEMRAETQRILGGALTQFKDMYEAVPAYSGGSIAKILESPKLVQNLSEQDQAALESFIPEYLSSITGTLRSKKKLKVVYDSLDAGKTIYLKKVLEEFRRKLAKDVQNESTWQDFLTEYILILRHSYGEVLQKESVSLQGKFPDFLLIDPYGYLDIYEIKKPSTNLMKLDASRNNYYWDTEISKAIAQTENYIHQSQRNADALTNDIRKHKGIEVNIVRPRGFIIAGKREQLKSKKLQDDFRILCDSLKNLDILLYDDLLESLESLVSRSSV